MSEPLLVDLSHTCHTRARTGVQRVVRSLFAALGNAAEGITFDPYAGSWRPLEGWEQANLAASSPAARRGARWPLMARFRGRARRLLQRPTAGPSVNPNAGLVVPEIFSPAVAKALPALSATLRGPRVALFHDAIALRYPELTPARTVARFPAYLQELLVFDGVAAISEDSRQSLLDYWAWLGVRQPPPVRTISLGLSPPVQVPPPPQSVSEPPVVLSVGSIEGRKNHVALLDGCELLWSRGARFRLQLIGLAHPQTGAPALARIRQLRAAGRDLRYAGPGSDAEVEAAYARCAFTVYPSLCEGFGLPVLESLARGKPCICSASGAVGESGRGGGGLLLDSLGPCSIANAISRLLNNPGECASLVSTARTRRFKSWPQYASELVEWINTLPRHG